MLTFRHVLTWLGVCGWWNPPLLVEGIGSELVEGGDDGGITLSWLEEKALDEEGLIKPSKIQTKGKACEDKSNINPTNPGFFKTWPCRAVEFSSNRNQIMVFRVTGRQWWSVTKYNYFVTVLKYIFQVSVLYWSSFILSNFYFYFTTFQSIRSYFLLHYIS